MDDKTVTADKTTTTDAGGDDERISASIDRILGKRLGSALEAALGPRLEAFRTELTPKAETKPTAGAAGAKDDVAAKFAALEADLAKERDARALERHQGHERDAFTALRAELAGKVRPDAVDVVAKLLFHADKNVRVDKNGKATFVIDDEPFSLSDGVARWHKSPAADLFKPAPGYGAPGPKKPVRGAPARNGEGGGKAKESPLALAKRLLAKTESR